MSKKRNTQPSASQGGIVLFGRGKDGKERAASFGVSHSKLAIKAAKALKFDVLPINNDIMRAIADKLPSGRIHASGLGVVPFVKPRLFEQVVAHCSKSSALLTPEPQREDTEALPSSASPTKKQSYRLPADWHDIAAGDLVITQDEDKTDGWWPAIVVENSGDRFVLRWYDYPRQRKFIRQRINLGLLNPNNSTNDDAPAKPKAARDSLGSRYPSSWADISANHLVLAQDDSPLGAWWPAIVAVSENGNATLRWHNYERLPAVVRELTSLALLHPQPE